MFQKDLAGLLIYCLSAFSVEHVVGSLSHNYTKVTLKRSALYVCEDWVLAKRRRNNEIHFENKVLR